MLRWGILGTGAVSRKFVHDLRRLRGRAPVTVVASRNRGNAEKFARDFAIPKVAGSYEEAASSSDVDALYIATPPSEHEAHALWGIAAGKAVLIEKPFANDAAAAGRIVNAARKARVFCMEAMWTRFMPLIAAISQRIESGGIGEVRAFKGAFCAADRPDAATSLFDPRRGGGALMHRGVYPLSLARLLLGPITDVEAMARPGDTGVDEDCAVTLRHASGALSSVNASLITAGANDFAVFGTKGTIAAAAPIYRPFKARHIRYSPRVAKRAPSRFERIKEGALAQGLQQRAVPLVHFIRSQSASSFTAHYKGNGYHYEARAVMDAVSNGRMECPLMPLDQTLEIMSVIDRARATWSGGERK